LRDNERFRILGQAEHDPGLVSHFLLIKVDDTILVMHQIGVKTRHQISAIAPSELWGVPVENSDEVRITLRLPARLRDRLSHAAEMNSRSMNGEIVERLDWTFDRSTKEMQSLLDQIQARDARIAELEGVIGKLDAVLARSSALADNAVDVVTSFARMMSTAATGDDTHLKELLEAYRRAIELGSLDPRLAPLLKGDDKE
jgi:hypothetical protein